MNIEQIKTYEEELKDLGVKQHDTAKSYLKARRRYAKANTYVLKELAKDLIRYRSEKRNLGVEMALLIKLAEAQKNQDQEFIKMYEQRELSLAEYKGLDRALEALQSKQTGIQSCVKWLQIGEINETTH